MSDARDSYGDLEEQPMNGLLRTAPKPALAIGEATVPMVTVYIGKCSGTARLMPRGLKDVETLQAEIEAGP